MTSWLKFPAEHSTPIPLYIEDMLKIFSWFVPSFIFITYVCLYVCMYIYVCMYMSIYTYTHIYMYIYLSLWFISTLVVCTHTILLNSRLHRVCYPRTPPTFGTAVTNHRRVSYKGCMILSILHQTLIESLEEVCI